MPVWNVAGFMLGEFCAYREADDYIYYIMIKAIQSIAIYCTFRYLCGNIIYVNYASSCEGA